LHRVRFLPPPLFLHLQSARTMDAFRVAIVRQTCTVHTQISLFLLTSLSLLNVLIVLFALLRPGRRQTVSKPPAFHGCFYPLASAVILRTGTPKGFPR
jgi:hypothetical protein